ncbi:hypothetical protein EXIGLDRAFT_293819 [Exidia glandulosa HHB12029]|uniref:Uncharacterized protein n=1 Tax=Exidia glandulosa HHB12029 TaxID=1314781 RepID=A0A165DDN2_EXIGL|nr:hypothetical protein EXIGLDRAFT_293819 [Exidia glandulosa HHB12029]
MDRAPSAAPSTRRGELSNKNYLLGIGLLGIVVLLWTGSNFLIQDLLEGGYDKPFLLTYLSTSTFALYLVPYLVRERDAVARWVRKSRRRSVDRSLYTRLALSDAEDNASPLRPLTHPPPPPSPVGEHGDAPLTVRETASLALTFSLLWFIANWSVNASLGYTSVASTTILTTTSGFFTLGVGALFRVEKVTIVKCGAVLASFCGVVLVSMSDSKQSPAVPAPTPPDILTVIVHQLGALFGDALALFSALFYALYVVFLKVRIGSEERVDMQLFFGFIGLFTFFLYWPFGLALHAFGIESLSLPHGQREIVSVLVNCSITFASDYLFLLAMLKTTPLVVTIGLSMTIPAAIAGDTFLGRPTAVQALMGGFLVLVGFVVVGWDDSKRAREDKARVPDSEEGVDARGEVSA